jgi:signal transduction histidine kinase
MENPNQQPLNGEVRPQDAIQRLWTISEALPGLVYQFKVEPDGTRFFTFISASIDNFLGIQSRELYADANVGFALVHPDDMKIVMRRNFFAAETLNQRTFVFRIKDGITGLYKWMRANALPDKQPDGSVIWNGIIIDVTGDKEAEEDRIAMAQEANRELESFNYTVSHDLQSPLRSILGFSQIMLNEHKGELTPEIKGYLEIIAYNARRMSDLTKNLLSFSKLGRAAINYSEVNMDTQVKKVIDELLVVYKNREIKIIRHNLSKATGGANLINQVWFNLLGNAFKYSSKKEFAVIEIGMMEGKGELIYYIKDNGAGFDMKDAGKLFVPFQRIHSYDEFEGSGIGLAIVHRIITKHGGRVWVEAKPGDGACFYFSLPVLRD